MVARGCQTPLKCLAVIPEVEDRLSLFLLDSGTRWSGSGLQAAPSAFVGRPTKGRNQPGFSLWILDRRHWPSLARYWFNQLGW
ncbi:hypothetical protein V6N13_051337 [Hibiscus sabdariffa]